MKKRPKDAGPSDITNAKSEIISVEQELTAANPKVFEGVKPEKKQEILRTIKQVHIVEQHHSGPIPDPDTLERYGNILPSAPERIVAMAERQMDHRIKIENKVIDKQLSESSRGQIFGFILCFLALTAATYLSIEGHDAPASVIGGSTILGLASIFVLGKIYKAKKEKSGD